MSDRLYESTAAKPRHASPHACSECSKPLGGNNRSGVCTPCQKGAKPGDGAVKPPPKPVRPDGESATKRMCLVADALGIDGQQLLEDFAQAWLDDVKQKATADDS